MRQQGRGVTCCLLLSNQASRPPCHHSLLVSKSVGEKKEGELVGDGEWRVGTWWEWVVVWKEGRVKMEEI